MITSLPSRLVLLVAIVSATGISACSRADSNTDAAPAKSALAAPAKTEAASRELDPIFAEPKVGDLYAAELSYFSAADFNMGRSRRSNNDEVSYGLMKVIEATPEKVVLITENGAWPKARGAINDLRGDLSEISWDDEEKITLKRSEIAGLVSDGKLLEARRIGD
jgi:hypothetical protein